MDPTGPTSYRLANFAQNAYDYPMRVFKTPGQGHPSLPHLCLLVFEAVLEVVCVSLPGYIFARLGHFDADKQKFLANLNVMLFTPCLSMPLASPIASRRVSEAPSLTLLPQSSPSWRPSSTPISFPISPSYPPSSSSRP